MKKITILLCTLFAILSCSNSNNWKEPRTYKESVLAIPDSTATPEQLALRNRIKEVLYTKQVTVKNKRLILNADTAYFIANEIPLSYIQFMQESLDETSDGFAKWEREGSDVDIEETFKRSQLEYWENKQKTTAE